jgi:hypothetical protein
MTVQIIQNISNWQEVADYTRNLIDRIGTAEQTFAANCLPSIVNADIER